MLFRERRLEPRESLALPLKLANGCAAVTRDISPSGLYLEMSGDHLMSGTVFFELQLAEARMRFSAEGQIVRLERREGWTGVAVKLVSPRLEPLG